MAEIATETDRLRLRTWDESDLDTFVKHTNTPAVMRWLGGVWTREAHERGFERIAGYQRDHGHTLWIVERMADSEMLGFCGLKPVNTVGSGAMHGEFEVGWRLREDAWGKGYAKEAAIASLDLAFEKFRAPHVVALTIAENRASTGLMERLGMIRRSDLDFETPDDWAAQYNPVIVYRLTREEWSEARVRALQPR